MSEAWFDHRFAAHPSRRGVLKGFAMAGLAAGSSGLILPRSARANPVKGGTLILGLAGANTTDTLDPGLAWDDFMMALSYGGLRNNLVELDAAGKPVGELAESWESSPDAKTWLFRLRQGVEFHNGKPLSVEDVVASINHHRGEASTSLAKSIFEQIAEVKADGPQAVRITLAEGNADLAILLSDYHLGVMPANPDGSVDWQSGIGTGGYKLDLFEAGVTAEASRFPNYWKQGRAHADSVRLVAINDATARQNALMTGEINVMNRVDPKTLSLLERSDRIRILEVQGYQHATMPMLVDVKPFDDLNVRLALKSGIDRAQWVQTLLRGHGTVGNDHPIPASQRYFNHELEQRTYDPDKAKHHLKQAGIDRLAVDLSTSDAAFAGAVDAALLFKESAAKAGIDINVVREPSDGYWSNVWAKKPFCTCYWTGRPTPDAVFSLIYARGASFGDTHWDNERFNALLIQARTEFDEARRAAMYGEMQALVRDDGGTIVPMFMNYVHGLGEGVGTPEQIAADLPLDGMKAIERWWVA
ncbi:MAG TPA: ABC transporter substrate-binding protein [Geminicoccus sp.]|jgi:peptide/nickel transport system substrate-binding protein|uniref:ABC transporter substrate-binding protein n=1 Tax=Geminicoccus sp. TaxID=2024832 RepID=UPI002E35B3D5|nr:ABC transporter substrate-binding protein [Geminicoccus sp.]HEX2527172.1 ABC transporter substrate-binding protein [Geminicoccus sp.]